MTQQATFTASLFLGNRRSNLVSIYRARNALSPDGFAGSVERYTHQLEALYMVMASAPRRPCLQALVEDWSYHRVSRELGINRINKSPTPASSPTARERRRS
ncbi:MAG TPA: hypothetical protein PKD54_02405 [Pirellulaceae bacterium]|nr:hypothetical protein [Pirellulaceae bacterium]